MSAHSTARSDADKYVLRNLVERHARERGQQDFALFTNGERWTLPKTPTQKVEKHVLRSEGLTDDTWDRESAGIRFKRERLASAGAGIRSAASR
jgi:hypothetical protein